MIITAIILLFPVVGLSAALNNLGDVLFLVFGLAWVGFVIMGGVFCLRRKHWGLCFTSSLLLALFVILGFFFFAAPLFLCPLGILPIVFVCLRKREWQEIQG